MLPVAFIKIISVCQLAKFDGCEGPFTLPPPIVSSASSKDKDDERDTEDNEQAAEFHWGHRVNELCPPASREHHDWGASSGPKSYGRKLELENRAFRRNSSLEQTQLKDGKII
mgnify:CR=1 FL=1